MNTCEGICIPVRSLETKISDGDAHTESGRISNCWKSDSPEWAGQRSNWVCHWEWVSQPGHGGRARGQDRRDQGCLGFWDLVVSIGYCSEEGGLLAAWSEESRSGSGHGREVWELEGDRRAWPRGGDGPRGKDTFRFCSGAQSTGLNEGLCEDRVREGLLIS